MDGWGDKDNTGGTTMGMDSHIKHALLARFSPTLSCQTSSTCEVESNYYLINE